MTASSLQGVADQVVRRAQARGSVVAREVREELSRAGLAEKFWKDVLALARPSLTYRRGRYHYTAPVSDRVRAEQSHQQDIRAAVERLVQQHQESEAARIERREQGRVDFILPVKVVTEDNRSLTFLSRDVSATGIRLIGTRRLLGQKVRVFIPRPGGADAPAPGAAEWSFLVRILWTCAVGDDLFENGGAFIEVAPTGS
jgi:hypothetical protein